MRYTRKHSTIPETFEYFIHNLMLQVWIKSLSSQGVPKDIAKMLTHDAFETMFNIFERYTGLSKEPIPQVLA